METTNLENLTAKVADNRKRQFCENIVKYRYFKTSETLKLIDLGGFSKVTATNYIDALISYLDTGKMYKQCKGLYKYIDEAIAKHIQPLTPRQDQKRIYKSKRKVNVVQKNQQLPIQKVLRDIEQQTKKPKNIQYAVQMNNNIRLCGDTIELAKAFQEGLSFMGNNNSKIVKVEIIEV